MEKKEIYEYPRLEIIFLGEPLSLMKNFSMNGGVDDWNNGDPLDNELDDYIGDDDWNYGGGLDSD